MPCLQRYLTANRNALLRDLKLLEERQTNRTDAAEAKTTDDTENDVPSPETED